MKSDHEAESPNPTYLLFTLAISLMAVFLLAIDATWSPSPGTRTILQTADTVLCGLFFIDFLVMLRKSKSRGRYLLTWGWLDLLSSVPLIPALRIGRLARVVRVVRVLRGIRSARVLTTFVLDRRAESTAMAALLVAITFVVFGSITILQLESVPNSRIQGPQDALWWTLGTLTTVGYGECYPVTAEGRIVAAVLMVAGVGLAGTVSGFIAAWFLSPRRREQEDEIHTIRREIETLRQVLERQGHGVPPELIDRLGLRTPVDPESPARR